MGYTTRPGTEITDFWPDDTENTMYLPSSDHSLSELIEHAKKKWPDATLDNIHISSEKIHTACIYYDLYDASDYTDFIIITHID
jgi:hypothetical protein